MKKNRIFVMLLLVIGIVISLYSFNNYYKNREIDIEKILNTSSYRYLSSNAKDYIRKYYYETGEVLLTEDNKEKGKVYLNPDYVEYLDGNAVGNTGYVPNALTYDYNVNISNIDDLPRSYDSRNVDGKNYVTSLKEQFSELCWDYSFTSVLESKLLKDGFENDATQLDLSERMIDYATSVPISAIDIGKNPYYGYYYNEGNLADVGSEYRYFSALINGLFPIYEKDWKYEKEYVGKVKPEDVYSFDNTNYQVNEVLVLKDNNYNVGFDEQTNKLLKQYIIDNGSVGLSIRVGVGGNYVSYYSNEQERLNDSNTVMLFYKDASALYQSNDHAVTIIGWNDDYEHNVCVLEDGSLDDSIYYNDTYKCNNGTLKKLNGAWIIKDSSSGNYNYVAYETVNSDYYTVTDISKKDWDNVYSSSNNMAYTKNNKTYIFNKYNNSEKLVSIKFFTSSPILNNEVYIDTYDGTGEKLLTTINVETAGMYTIKIPDEIILSSDKFSIRNMAGYNFSIFTSDIGEENIINIDDGSVENSFDYQVLLDNYQNVIVLNGESRGVNDSINYVIKDSNGLDVTNLFDITRNYSVGNYINSLIRFNNNVSKGEYTVYVYIDNELYTDFKISIGKYMENISGDGSPDNPFIITNPVQLDMIRLNMFNSYKLGNDIDLTYDTQDKNGLFYNNGQGWEPISYSECHVSKFGANNYCDKGFTGSFDGNNHKIVGLFINRPDEYNVGLFRNTNNSNYSGLSFRNIILKDVNVTGKDFVGGLIGYAYGTTYERTLIIENISISGSVRGNNYVGGLIGMYKGGSILFNYLVSNTSCENRQCLKNLFNSANVNGNDYVGGIVGTFETQSYYGVNEIWRSTVEANNWQNNGTITSNNNAAGFAGNVLIENGNKMSISDSINTGIINGKSDVAIVNNIDCKNEDDKYPNCSLVLNNIYYSNEMGYVDNDLITASNVKKYDILELTDNSIYDMFTDFDTYYNMKSINGIARIPLLKNADIEYTDIEDIFIDGDEEININDYVNNKGSIVYNIADDTIASINDKGIMVPLKSGSTTIHITSYYDGYDKDINLIIDLSNRKYTITYNLNGGVADNPTTYDINTNTFILNNPTKEGYIFTGWTGSNGDIPQLEVNIKRGSTGNLNYIANWDIIKYKVSYDTNGGNTILDDFVNYGNIINRPNNPVKEGYIFKYWLLNDNIYDFNMPVFNNITLVAVWEKVVTSLSEILTRNGYKLMDNYVMGFEVGVINENIVNKLGDINITLNSKTNIISTGTVISRGEENYIVVIKGDLNGDGKINSGDLFQMRKYLLGDIVLDGASKRAGIIGSVDDIKSLDLLRLRQYLLGMYDIRQ